jgi:hypothetical protein
MNYLSFLSCIAWAGALTYLGHKAVEAWAREKFAAREERLHAKDTKTVSDFEHLRDRLAKIELTLNMKPLQRKASQ